MEGWIKTYIWHIYVAKEGGEIERYGKDALKFQCCFFFFFKYLLPSADVNHKSKVQMNVHLTNLTLHYLLSYITQYARDIYVIIGTMSSSTGSFLVKLLVYLSISS